MLLQSLIRSICFLRHPVTGVTESDSPRWSTCGKHQASTNLSLPSSGSAPLHRPPGRDGEPAPLPAAPAPLEGSPQVISEGRPLGRKWMRDEGGGSTWWRRKEVRDEWLVYTVWTSADPLSRGILPPPPHLTPLTPISPDINHRGGRVKVNMVIAEKLWGRLQGEPGAHSISIRC